MELTRIGPTLVDRLLENQAAHLSVMADVANAYAHVAREKADAAQRSLSELKIFLLPSLSRAIMQAQRGLKARQA